MSLVHLPLLSRLAKRIDQGDLSARWIDLYAAQHVVDCHGDAEPEPIANLALYLSWSITMGTICLPLSALTLPNPLGLKMPNWSRDEWRAYLHASAAVETDNMTLAGQGELPFHDPDSAPLVLNGDAVYLSRYWIQKHHVDTWLKTMTTQAVTMKEDAWSALAQALQDAFSLTDESENNEPDWQAVAAAQALTQRLCLITGGPGTGKTTTASHILSLLVRQHVMMHESTPRVRLLAPTGKAAIRLFQSVKARVSEQALLSMPENGETIHRFLNEARSGRSMSSDDFLIAQDTSNRAAVDIVLIDEASMIDLSLMASLIEVLPDHSRVVMMGDHFQLPAVEPGQIFSDWVREYWERGYNASQQAALACLLPYSINNLSIHVESESNPLAILRKTYRFGGELKQVADLMKQGAAQDLVSLLTTLNEGSSHDHGVRWYPQQQAVFESIIHGYETYFEGLRSMPQVDELDKAFSRFQVLCSTHEGPLGAESINQWVERKHGLANRPYHGKPIMVTENHHKLGVYNGDIGFFLQKPGGHFVVGFNSIEGGFLELAPDSIRDSQVAYAITVHKSQGSEYDHVSLVIPDYTRELLSRPMLYTGLTRGKYKADIWVSENALTAAL